VGKLRKDFLGTLEGQIRRYQTHNHHPIPINVNPLTSILLLEGRFPGRQQLWKILGYQPI